MTASNINYRSLENGKRPAKRGDSSSNGKAEMGEADRGGGAVGQRQGQNHLIMRIFFIPLFLIALGDLDYDEDLEDENVKKEK